MVETIYQSITDNFDFAYMISCNILTYLIIKFIDYLNGTKPVTFWQKRIILIICIVSLSIIYYNTGEKSTITIINSAIATPVFWSWIIKPIISKTKLDYKSIDKTLN